MSTVVKAGTARDFLGLLPTMLGFLPTESIVLVPFAGPRTVGVMRFDLPTEDAELGPIISTVVGMVCKVDSADGVAAVVYTSARPASAVTGLLRGISAGAERCGLAVKDLLYVAADGWGSVTEGADPRPLTELTVTEVEGIKAPTGNQLGAADLPVLSDDLLRDVGIAISTFEPEFATDPIILFETLVTMDTAELTGEMIAYLGFVLERPAIRDVCLVQWTQGQAAGERAVQAQLQWNEGMDYPEDLARHMWGEGIRPDPARLERGLELARITASAISLPGSYATCAWLAWALGRSSQANQYAQQGLAIEPGHGLCEIVASFVHAGHLPDWAFTSKS